MDGDEYTGSDRTSRPIHWPRRDPLGSRAETTPETVALVETETGSTWTCRELSASVDAVATELTARIPESDSGAGGRRVGYLLEAGPEFVATLYALWRLGWTAVGLHTGLAPGELEAHADAAELDAVVFESGTETLATTADCPTVAAESIVELDDIEMSQRTSSRAASVPEPATWNPDDTALILFTSGTTDEPKGVRLTLGNLLASATASAFRLGVDPDDRWLCCLPVSHMGGLAPTVRTVLYGATLVVQRGFDASATARALDTRQVTQVSLVPTQLKRLLDAGWTPDPSLRTVLLGGAPATRSLLERADEAGVPVYPTYGMTEAASQIATARPAECQANPGTVGRPLVCTDVTIVDGDRLSDPGEHGEIVVDGPTITPGYLEPAQTRESFGKHGFHTGDVGYRDENGRLWITGRLDEVLITGGELVCPTDVADVLVTHEGVDDAAVVGLPDEEWGQRVAAVVVPNEETVNESELKSYCRERLSSFKVPKQFGFTDEILRTASGTVKRDAVRELFEGT